MQVKKVCMYLLVTVSTWAGFEFGQCSGSGSFKQSIEYYAGNYEHAVTVGSIPKGIQGLHVELESDADVDIRLYGQNNDKIVHWPYGLLRRSTKETKNYYYIPITYSGYNGIHGKLGHEFIEVDGSTPTPMEMKAFGYRAGYAQVNYSWTGKDGCTASQDGAGHFEQEILDKEVAWVGTIPENIDNVEINLMSGNDLDIQLYAANGTSIIRWPNGLLGGPSAQEINFHGMHIEWSGYNGVNGQKGYEYIKLVGLITEKLTMKVYGYKSGHADVYYKWGKSSNTSDTMAPTITLLGNTTVTLTQGDSYIDAGATANDNVDGDITANIVVNNPVNTNVVGTYTVRYNVSDQAGNSASEVTRTVVVEAPAIATTHLPLLMIRIEFNDYTFNSTASVWHDKIYTLTDGTLNDYYNEISYGKFQFDTVSETDDIADDAIITVQLNINHPNPGTDINAFLPYLNDALALADSKVDFSLYDTNGNGAISIDELQIMFIVAGGESATGTSPGIWAHAWCMYGGNETAPTHDGVKLMNCADNGGYSVFGERHGTRDATIGVMAHELGHAVFNLPDLYDVDGSSEGIGNFGLMGSGAWGYKAGDTAAGMTPVHMTGWSKIQSGFVVPTTLTSNAANLNLIETSSSDYVLYKLLTGKSGEYFLIENRGAGGYDRGLNVLVGTFNGGLSILHIDDSLSNNADETHKLVDVEEANNAGLDTKAHRGDVNNLYFLGNKDAFTDTTTPNTKRYDGQNSGIKVENISENAAIMTADITVQ